MRDKLKKRTNTPQKPLLYHFPIYHLPQIIQVRRTHILVIQVVGMLPDVEGEERLEMPGQAGHDACDGITCSGLLGDDESTVRIGGEPNPAGAEEGDAFGDEVGFEGVEGAPLLDNLFLKMPGRAGHDGRSGLELREIEIVVQDLAGVVEDGQMPGQAGHDGCGR